MREREKHETSLNYTLSLRNWNNKKLRDLVHKNRKYLCKIGNQSVVKCTCTDTWHSFLHRLVENYIWDLSSSVNYTISNSDLLPGFFK